MKFCISILFVVVLCSCGAQHKLNKAERLIKEAVARGAKVTEDTTFTHVAFEAPAINFNTTLKAPNWQDTLIIKGKDSLVVKIKRIIEPGKTEKVFVDVQRPPEKVVQKIPIYIDRKIEVGYSLWQLIILAIFCLVIGYFSRIAIKSFQSFFAKG